VHAGAGAGFLSCSCYQLSLELLLCLSLLQHESPSKNAANVMRSRHSESTVAAHPAGVLVTTLPRSVESK